LPQCDGRNAIAAMPATEIAMPPPRQRTDRLTPLGALRPIAVEPDSKGRPVAVRFPRA
jgi:hypothetical protein